MLVTVTLSLLLAGGPSSVHDFRVKTIDGNEVSLSQYQGKALLIVNTASECGYTPHPVKGPKADPLYRYLTSLPENGGEVTWNFNKFVVDPKGRVVAHLDSGVEPTSAEMRKRIEGVLPSK